MAKESKINQYHNKSDIEKSLKSDKNFMNSHSAAEFDAYVDGALWMLNIKQSSIDNMTLKLKNSQNRIVELSNELAPYRELYENYEFVEKRSKKSKKKSLLSDFDDDDEAIDFNDDDYGDITGEDFE